MDPVGSDEPILYVLGDMPTREDDEEGEPFYGRSGDLVQDFLPSALKKHVRWSNSVQCRTPGYRQPTVPEIAACSQRVEADIERTKPLIVLGMGLAPLRWVTDATRIDDWRGEFMPIKVGSWTCWYAQMWHPVWMSRKKADRRTGDQYYRTYKRDLERVFERAQGEGLSEPWVPEGEELSAGLHWSLDWKVDTVAEHLEAMRAFDKQSVDIETNALRPYNNGSKILSIAFGAWERSFAIPINHSESKWTPKQLKQVWELVRRHLTLHDIEFWAHHLKFETEWLSMPFALGRNILFEVNWQDTMAQAHVLSSRGLEANSLDSRCLALFGVREKQLDDLDRARLDTVPLVKVLRYNARDTKFTDMARRLQTPMIEEQGLVPAYTLMIERVPALTIAQQEGVIPDTAEAERLHETLQTQIKTIEAKIQALPDVVAFSRAQGKPFNSGSSKQLVPLLRDRLKFEEGWYEEGGVRKYSTDEKVLAQIDHPIARLILDKRGLDKLDSTYVVGLCKNGTFKGVGKLLWDDGLVHTIYNYLLTTTGRLSSEDPNLQNFPKRKHREIRRAIMAALGYSMVSIDYGQIEARIIAIAAACPVLGQALWEHYDIHMAWARIIGEAHPEVMVKYMREAKKDEAKAFKLFRSDIKNQWTFPLFYGSQLDSVARAIGLQGSVLKPQFKKFWEMFEAVKQWQDKTVKLYNQKGYVETLTGRRRYEPLSLNEMINSPIQGTASDVVVDASRRLANAAYERQDWDLVPRMNVHDDLTFYLKTEELEEKLDVIVPIMCQPEFDWVTVPITVEVSIGKNWCDQEELATIESTDYGYPQIEAPKPSRARGRR